MEVAKDDLQTILNTWSRIELIEWLSWKDSNGVYRDQDSLREFGNTVFKEEAREIIIRQI